jgi:hypothetical protein
MAYYKDFRFCTYFDTGAWLCRLVAIGWIEHGKPFETGPALDDFQYQGGLPPGGPTFDFFVHQRAHVFLLER